METLKLSPQEEAARRKRNRAIALILLAFMALVFLITLANLHSGGQLPGMRWNEVQQND